MSYSECVTGLEPNITLKLIRPVPFVFRAFLNDPPRRVIGDPAQRTSLGSEV